MIARAENDDLVSLGLRTVLVTGNAHGASTKELHVNTYMPECAGQGRLSSLTL